MRLITRYVLIISLVILLVGCTTNEPKSEKNKTSKRNDLDLVALLETKPYSSPSETAIHQYQFVFKNKMKSFPAKSSIVNEVSLGGKSLVILNTQDVDGNFIILDYERNLEKWNLRTIASLNVKDGQYFNNKEGLNLPFNSFVVNIGHEDTYSVWAFANKQKIAVIVIYDAVSFTLPKNLETFITNGKVFFISEKPKDKYLYYYDSNKLVVISGNLQKLEMINLAKSLPPQISAEFLEY